MDEDELTAHDLALKYTEIKLSVRADALNHSAFYDTYVRAYNFFMSRLRSNPNYEE